MKRHNNLPFTYQLHSLKLKVNIRQKREAFYFSCIEAVLMSVWNWDWASHFENVYCRKSNKNVTSCLLLRHSGGIHTDHFSIRFLKYNLQRFLNWLQNLLIICYEFVLEIKGVKWTCLVNKMPPLKRIWHFNSIYSIHTSISYFSRYLLDGNVLRKLD